DLATDDERQRRARSRGRPETALDEHGRHDSDRVRWPNAHGDRWRTASLEARHPNELVGSGPLGPSLAQGSLRKEAPFVYAQTFRRAAVPRVLDRTGRPRTGRPVPDRLRHRALQLVLAALSESHRVLHRRRDHPALPVRLLELQVGWIYLMTGLEKMAGTLWKNGTATFYALQLEHTFGRSWAYPIATSEVISHLMSWGTIVVEHLFLPLTMLPFRVTRILAVIGAVMLHGGILTLMNVGNFPVIMLSTLIIFLPPEWIRGFVAGIETRLRPRVRPHLVAATAGATQRVPTARFMAPSPARKPTLRQQHGVRVAASIALIAIS